MSNKHTPGPWKFGYTDSLEYPLIIGADDEVVCVMHEGVSIKDGNLLAMAPELLEALKAVLNEFAKDGHGGEFEDGEHPYVDTARAAIAKATVGAA